MSVKQIQIPCFGAPEVLACVDVAVPAPAQEQSKVKVVFAGVNPIDAKTRAGLGWAAEQNRDRLPWSPGYDIAGETLDDKVFPVGTLVCGMIGFPLAGGGYSQQLNVAREELCQIPDGVSLKQAAALPLAGLTAWQGLFQHGALQFGEQVVILGANGGVGHLALQLARYAGADVIAVAERSHWPWLQSLGADKLIDPSDLSSQALSADLLLDLVGGDTGEQGVSLFGRKGRVVTVPTVTADRIIASAGRKGLDARRMLVSPDTEQLQLMLGLCAKGELKVEVDSLFPMRAASQAHRWLEQRGHRGKALLQMQ